MDVHYNFSLSARHMDVKRNLIRIGNRHMGSSTILKMIIQICIYDEKQHCLHGFMVRICWLKFFSSTLPSLKL